MSFLGGLFSDTEKQTTNQQQSGFSQGNAWNDPRLQALINQISGNVTTLGGGTGFEPVNNWMTSAANQQQNVAGGLNPAFTTVNNIATNGLNPADIDRFRNNNTDNYVKALQTDFNTQNARDLSGVQGQAAKLGAITGTGTRGAVQQAREGQTRVQAPIIEQARYKAQQDATTSALANQGQQIGAAGTAGSLTGAATGANTGLGGLGQNIWSANYQNTMTPYQLQAQQAGLAGQLFGQAGQSTSGTTQGTTSTTATPSMASIFGGLAGGLMSGMPGGGLGAMTGMIPYGSFAGGGAVGGDMPAVGKSLHDKVTAAFDMLQGLRDKARRGGGPVNGYADGSTVTDNYDYPGSSIADLPLRRTASAIAAPDSMRRPTLSSFPDATPMPSRYGSDAEGAGYDDTSAPGTRVAGSMTYAPQQGGAPAGGNGWFQGGMWAGEREDNPVRNLARVGLGIQSPRFKSPFGGVNDQLKTIRDQNIQEKSLERLMEQLKLEQQRVTMEQERQPGLIRLQAAQAGAQEVAADKEFLLEMERKKMAYAKELAMAEREGNWDLVQRLRRQAQTDEQARSPQSTAPEAGAPTAADRRTVWITPQQQPAAETPAEVTTTVAPTTTPATTTPAAPASRRLTSASRQMGGSPERPWSSKAQAAYGEYYRGDDGGIYERTKFRSALMPDRRVQ